MTTLKKIVWIIVISIGVVGMYYLIQVIRIIAEDML